MKSTQAFSRDPFVASRAINTLVVEDDEDHAKLLQIELARVPGLAFTCVWCSSLEDALDRIHADHFDLILLDYWLGTHNSEPLLDELRTKGNGATVIVTTGANDEYVAASVSRAGAHGYLSKRDIKVTSLAETIRRAISDSQGDRERATERASLQARLDRLTPREIEIARLIADGLMSKQIAAQIGCTEGTVNLHRSHIMNKTGSQSVADLVRTVLICRNN